MRIFINAQEAFEEVKRDLAEMGIKVYPKTMQDKNIEGNEDYVTMELQNYGYQILKAIPSQIPGVSQPWADAEFMERITPPKVCSDFSTCEECHKYGGSWDRWTDEKDTTPILMNPGEAYKLRPEVWNEYLHEGRFGYTYNERFWQNNQFTKIINQLKNDPGSRQIWLSLWNPEIDPDHIGGKVRVPCSIGYGFQVREGKLNIHYVMRSSDFATHFANDVYLAMRLLEFVAGQTGYEVGSFTHTIFSLHIYQKDISGTF
jgi:hypothetical protein